MKVNSKHFRENREYEQDINKESKAFQTSGVGRKTRVAALIMAFFMLSPLSSFASTSATAATSANSVQNTAESNSLNSADISTEAKSELVSESESDNMIWEKWPGIEIAVASGKAIELNKVFEYEGKKIKFEYAIWEEDSLLLIYSLPDKEMEFTTMPSKFALVNKEGVNVSYGWGMSSNDNGRGYIEFDLQDKFIDGDELYLNIYTIRPERPDIYYSNYTYTMLLDNSLSTKGYKYNLYKEYKTDYGTLKLKTANNEDGRLTIDYTYELLPEVKEITRSDSEKNIYFHIFPDISIQDTKGTIVRANGSSYEANGEAGKIYFNGMPELGQNLTLFIKCSEKVVNWKLVVPVNRVPAEIISINKEFKSDNGILKLKDLHLDAASTYLDFEFIPKKESKVNIVEPKITMNLGKKKIPGLVRTRELNGKIDFNYPLSEKDFDDAILYLYSIERSVQCDEGIKVDFDKNQEYKKKVDGSEIAISNIVVKDGKTCFDIGTNDVNRKFIDFHVEVQSENKPMSWSSTSSFSVFNRETGVIKEPINKSIEVDGEHKSFEITISCLIYSDIYNCEIKLK